MECEPLRAATKKVLFRNGLVSVIDKSQGPKCHKYSNTKKVLFRNGLVSVIDKSQRPKCQKYSNIATEKALIKDGSAMGEHQRKKKIIK